MFVLLMASFLTANVPPISFNNLNNLFDLFSHYAINVAVCKDSNYTNYITDSLTYLKINLSTNCNVETKNKCKYFTGLITMNNFSESFIIIQDYIFPGMV